MHSLWDIFRPWSPMHRGAVVPADQVPLLPAVPVDVRLLVAVLVDQVPHERPAFRTGPALKPVREAIVEEEGRAPGLGVDPDARPQGLELQPELRRSPVR